MASQGIRLTKLWKRYGDVVAVKGIDLTVEKGEFVTLLGPSGSGKTTTLRMIAGLEVPDEGVIEIQGRPVSGKGKPVPAYKRNMGMVFQSYAVWPHKTVYENIAFPLKIKGIGGADERKRVERMMELVELPVAAYAERYPAQLSGGQQQRVALARALVADPDVILYDEPLSNLDARLRDSMRILLRRIHNELNVTAVYVTHDQIEAMVLSDRVCVMNHGEIVQEGTPRELYDKPTHLFVAEFVGQANVLQAELTDVAGMLRLAGGMGLRVPDVAMANGSSGTQRSLVIRHHQVHLLSAADSASDNSFEGTVDEVDFLGDRIRYSIRIAEGCNLISEVPARPGLPAAGDRVRVWLPAESCIVI